MSDSNSATMPPALAAICHKHGLEVEAVSARREYDELLDSLAVDLERIVRNGDASGSSADDGGDAAPKLRDLVRFIGRVTALKESQGNPLSGAENLAKVSCLLDELASLAHQINNPLTTLIGRAQILKMRNSADEKLCRAAEVMEESGQRVARHVRSVSATVYEAKRALEADWPLTRKQGEAG